jgi:hypothetical protein
MNARSTIGLLTALTMVMAGCAGSRAEPLAVESEEPVTSEVGIIRGIVIDEAVVPIPNANVSVFESPIRTRSGSDGQFELRNVPAGEHRIVVEAQSYESASLTVSVEVGGSAFAQIQLKRIAGDIGYFTTKIGRGILFCSATYRQAILANDVQQPASFTGASCNVLNSTGVDQSTYFYWVSDDLSLMRGAAAETVWSSSQAFGNGLVQDWAVIGCANNRNASFGRDYGPSPLQNILGSFELEYRINDIPNSSCDAAEHCNLTACQMIVRVFSWPSTNPDAVPVDVGITLSQTYSHYVTEFYLQEPPPDFTALADA